MATREDDSNFIPVEAVAMMVGVTTRSIYRYVETETNFPRPVRIGGLVRWRRKEVERWLASLQSK